VFTMPCTSSRRPPTSTLLPYTTLFRSRPGAAISSQVPTREDQVLDRSPTHEVLVDDPVELFPVQVGVPGALWIDDGDAPLLTDPETVDLGPEHRPVPGLDRGVVLGALPRRRRRGDAELLETGLEMDPQLMGLLTRGALGIGLIGAEEYVPARPGDRERFCD